MYWEWGNLSGAGDGNDRSTVLSSLPPDSAKEVTAPVIRHIVSTLGISQPPAQSSFETDKDVDWCLQIVCYGLSLPFTEHEIIKDCVSIYCEWLSCLAPVPKLSVPRPIVDRPDFYARKIINHLHHLFVPRKEKDQDTINRQAIHCHRVLRVLQNAIKTSNYLEPETWECVLLFLISINDAMLSPPSVKDDIADQLCERVLSVLFEVWLLACGKCFPSPPLWKTLRESCQAWRHRPNLFDQWNRINLLLTGRVLNIMYGVGYAPWIEDDGNLVPANMTDDCVVQTWFRFLHTVGNPVELTQPTVISQTQNFLQFAIANEAVIDPCQHPCLSTLPTTFHQAFVGIGEMVDAFLGLSPRVRIEQNSVPETESSSSATTNPSPVPPMRRIAKSFSVASSSSSSVQKGSGRNSLLGIGRAKDTSSIPSSQPQSASGSIQSIQSTPTSINSVFKEGIPSTPLARRPKVNSILHIFGPWLFEAALSCCEPKHDGEVRRTSRGSAVPAALPESIDIPHSITIDKYYLGRAEALRILCKIFSSKQTGEDILPSYLARFYIAVNMGLKDTRHIEVLISILSNSSVNLLRTGMDGVMCLTPAIVTALEAVLPSKDALRNDRRSAIVLLLSLLSLPLHFLNVPIREVLGKNGHVTTFMQLKPRLANLLTNTLQVETDSVNIQMLLGGLLMFVSDIAAFEEVDKASVNLDAESPINIMSSEDTSMRSFSDYSNSFDEHLPDAGEGPIDSAHALFVRSTYLICHKLISTWKIDLPVSLACLELLNGLARIKIQDQDPLECRRAVKWTCDFIIHQCSRPPPSHSKDLHSSIVAAFQCVTTWLTAHPETLDKDTLYTVLEVVEFGISGTKSQGKPGDTLKLKDEKDLKPVSLRVRDAAEALLAVIFEQVGKYAPSNGVKTSSLDEFVLLSQIYSQENLTKDEVIKHFRYFVIDHTILISLFEEPLGNNQDPQPTVTMILRGPTGRHTWTLQLRHMSRCKSKSFSNSGSSPGRPLPINDVGIRYDILHRFFPESADRIVFCKADNAIPGLDCISGNSETADQDALEQSRLSMILENQIRLEKSVENMIREEADESYERFEAQAPPPVSQEFQTARLLLSHLGCISTKDEKNDFSSSKLVAIDSTHPDFITELENLDATSCRTCDTVHVFYVRSGQKTKEEILANVQTRENVHAHFLEFLLSLGWPVNISHHAGWTGNIHTSWKHLNPHEPSSACLNPLTANKNRGSSGNQKENENHGGSLYNGERFVLYWTDVTSEIAFIVPTLPTTIGKNSLKNEETAPVVWDIGGESITNPTQSTQDEKNKVDSNAKEFEKHFINSNDGGNKSNKAVTGKLIDTKIFVVWLEKFEDSFHFPAADLMSSSSSTNTGVETNCKPLEPSLIIFIHALQNGLFRIKMEGEPLRMGLATPLIDGMVVSRRVLGNLVRQTSLNMARRKRLENDSYQPPHVRRKLKVQEISTKFMTSLSAPEFYAHFFQGTPQQTSKSDESYQV